ncbi:MAG: hypothetical protein LBL06_00355 [Treponema sp.]|nr:hypothetical protein [Treponema sp.]
MKKRLPNAHPSGVRRLLNGRCTKEGAADPDRTTTLARKRSLLVVRRARAGIVET